jgi:hypothetical protein
MPLQIPSPIPAINRLSSSHIIFPSFTVLSVIRLG